MNRREPSLFTRLVALIAVVFAAGAGVLIGATWHYARTAANEAYDRMLLGAALQIAGNITVQDGALAPDLPTAAFEMLSLSERDRIFYRVVGVHGETVTGYEDLTTPEIRMARARPVIVSGQYHGEPVRIAVVGRIISDADVSGWTHVLLAQTELSRVALARELTVRAVALVLAMSLLALCAVVLAVHTALAPLQRLEFALRQRDPNDLTALTIATPRELRPFVSTINHFMSRLGERMNLLQHFIADAAHQIRTPLTALCSQAELLSNAEMEPKAHEHVARVQHRAAQLAHLTNQLLSHAMVIHRTEAVPFVLVDLVEVARRALREAIPVSLDRDIDIALETSDDPVTILGEPVSLREALANVIDNAVRHGAPSRLTVRVRDEGRTAVVEVDDDGPGIPHQRWEEVTKRFGAGTGAGRSAGLGFAIASEVCAAHHGSLQFSGGENRGFTVALRFPKQEGSR